MRDKKRTGFQDRVFLIWIAKSMSRQVAGTYQWYFKIQWAKFKCHSQGGQTCMGRCGGLLRQHHPLLSPCYVLRSGHRPGSAVQWPRLASSSATDKLWFWATYLISLYLRFLICKMEIIMSSQVGKDEHTMLPTPAQQSTTCQGNLNMRGQK